ncbi:MAG: ATP-binding protein [Candidatus Omnitrophota bacterium]
MTWISRKEKAKAYLLGGIRRKITALIVAIILIFIAASSLTAYFGGMTVLRRVVVKHQLTIVQLMADSVAEMIESEETDLHSHVSNVFWEPEIIASNARYSVMRSQDIAAYFKDKDRVWALSSENSPVVRDYIDNALGLRLKTITEANSNISELFVTDMYGGLVATTAKTSDFYQADELWWQRTYNGGKGDTFIGDIEFDESSGVWAITVAEPIYGNAGEVIGVCKEVLNALGYLNAVYKFRMGTSGYATLLDGNGSIIAQNVSKEAEPTGSIYHNWSIINEARNKAPESFTNMHRHGRGVTLMSWAPVLGRSPSMHALNWTACIEQDLWEILEGQKFDILRYSITLFVILLFLLVPFGLLLVRLLTRPLERLRQATRELAMGKLDRHVELSSGDEFEDLADSFNAMTDTLRDTMVSRDALAAEIAEREKMSRELDAARDKLAKQNKMLEAQLNERGRSHEMMVSMLDDNNHIREDLEKSLANLKEAQNMLVRAEKLETIGRLASGVAHEVRNPLGIILQGANYFEDYIPAKETEAREVLQIIKYNISRADKITRALLDLSRTSELHMRPEDVNALIESSLHLVQYGVGFDNIKVIKEFGEGLPDILADKVRIEQVFVNILRNSVQAMSGGGTLTIRTYAARFGDSSVKEKCAGAEGFVPGEKVVAAEIEDTGEGISEDNLKKVCEPFFTTKEPNEGSGMGLSVSRSIIETHKGIMNITSKLSKGTKVTVFLKPAEAK